jgi:hypothetical protein
MENSQIRDIDPTTKRLVDRCLSGEWCIQYRKANIVHCGVRADPEIARVGSPGSDSFTFASFPGIAVATISAAKRRDQLRSKDSKGSSIAQQSERLHHNRNREDSHLLSRTESLGTGLDGLAPQLPHPPPSHNSLPATPSTVSLNTNSKTQSGTTHRRSAPPTPGKRRKPPAVPLPATERTNSGATITPIASSNPTSNGKVMKSSSLQHSLV